MFFSVFNWNQKRSLPYPASFLFNLVLDIETYPQFLPQCQGVQILKRQKGSLKARLDIGFSMISTSFPSVVTWEKDKQILITSAVGSFRSMQGTWRFQESKGQGSLVSLDIHIDFGSALKRMAFMPFVSFLTTGMIDAFEKRAQHLFEQKP